MSHPLLKTHDALKVAKEDYQTRERKQAVADVLHHPSRCMLYALAHNTTPFEARMRLLSRMSGLTENRDAKPSSSH
jgi:hypothetical protein